MRKKTMFFFILLISAFVMGSVAQAGEFGAPAPYTKEGQFSGALGYSYANSKVKLNNRTVTDRGDQKIEQNQLYLEGGYGFMKDWEAFGRIGGADLKGKDAFLNPALPGGKEDFKDSMKLFGTLGARGLIHVAPTYSVGLFLQGTIFSEYKHTDADQSQFKIQDMYELDFGVAAQTNLGSAVVYGGPFVYMFRAKIEDTDLSIPAVIGNAKYKEKTPVGGFAGARFPLGGGYFGNIEGRFQSGFVGALSLLKAF